MNRSTLGKPAAMTALLVGVAIVLFSVHELASARPFLTPVEPPPTPTGYMTSDGGVVYAADGAFQVSVREHALRIPAVVTAYSFKSAPKVPGFTVIGPPYCFTIWIDGKPLLQTDRAVVFVRRNYGKVPAGREKQLTIAIYDEKKGTWKPLGSRVNVQSRTVQAEASSFLATSFCDRRNRQVLVALVLQNVPSTGKAGQSATGIAPTAAPRTPTLAPAAKSRP